MRRGKALDCAFYTLAMILAMTVLTGLTVLACVWV